LLITIALTFDGICSGAIVKHKHPNVELIGLDYGDDYDEKIFSRNFTGKTIFFVDITLQPRNLMLQLTKDNRIIVLDHHITSINDIKALGWKPEGILDTKYAGCELTWQYLFPDKPMPIGVKYLGSYDRWDHTNPHTELFQYGMKYINPGVDAPDWDTLFSEHSELYIAETIATGGVVRHWNAVRNKKTANMSAREVIFEGWRAICINGYDGSPLFNSVYDETKHDIMVSYIQRSDGKWRFGLYSDKPEVHCGDIAQNYGGGGHKGAAGFTTEELIF
jgi:uncharacterized protein